MKRVGKRFLLEDLGSGNGTSVNGQIIRGPSSLRSGDEIRIGPVIAVLSLQSAISERSPLGTTSDLQMALAAECDRCYRYGRNLALVMIRLEGRASEVDAVIEQLSKWIRRMDSVCEYGPDEIAVMMPELNLLAAEQAVESLLAKIRGVDTVRVGVAVAPEHGNNPDKLIGQARSALQVARIRGVPVAVPPVEQSNSGVIVHDPQMKRVFQLVDKVANSNMTVLIHGETGCGKEIVASALHQRSNRNEGPYIRLNCASIPETLLESELFGHEKGAFTGAERRKQGYFEAAVGGTIFLDEVGEISAAVQAKLLRVLESRSITRVGGTKELAVDVRIVCATNRELEIEVKEGRFREDLFYRIGAFTIVVPALRDRPADILPLCEHYLSTNSLELGQAAPQLSVEAKTALCAYGWPGNVRQLRNAMERAVVLASDGIVHVDDLPDGLRLEESSMQMPMAVGVATDVKDQLAGLEQKAIEEALLAFEDNQTKAARSLGLSRRALIYKMEKYGLKKLPASRQKKSAE